MQNDILFGHDSRNVWQIPLCLTRKENKLIGVQVQRILINGRIAVIEAILFQSLFPSINHYSPPLIR